MRRVALVLLIPSLVAPLAARQQAPPPPASPERVPQTVGMTGDEIADLNRRIRTFQAAVHSAIENGGSRLADRAEKLVQGAVELAMNGTPRINPVYIPGTGFHYDVQVPDILGTSFAMWSYLYKRQQQHAIPLAGRPPDERVTANSTVVKADTMVADTNFDPNTEYATFVRQELIEAMLESSTVLPIKSDEKLIISARVPAEAQANVLSHYKRIVLQIHGSDLQAYRQGQLTKDQVKERVLEFRY